MIGRAERRLENCASLGSACGFEAAGMNGTVGRGDSSLPCGNSLVFLERNEAPEPGPDSCGEIWS